MEKVAKALKIDRLQYPAVKSSVNVDLSVFLDKRGGYSNNGYSTIERCTVGQSTRMSLLK